MLLSRRTGWPVVLTFALLLIAAVAPRAEAAIAPTITFEAEAVVVSDITPGGNVAWFSVAREIDERFATIVARRKIVQDKEETGSARYELDRGVPFQSIWVAVDLTTGIAAVATPEGYPLRQADLPAASLGRTQGKDDWVEDTRSYVEVMVVRPADGSAWWSAAGDGGIEDDDGVSDGQLEVPLSTLHDVEGSAGNAPESFAAGDLVVVIDPNLMEVGLRRFEEVP